MGEELSVDLDEACLSQLAIRAVLQEAFVPDNRCNTVREWVTQQQHVQCTGQFQLRKQIGLHNIVIYSLYRTVSA